MTETVVGRGGRQGRNDRDRVGRGGRQGRNDRDSGGERRETRQE